MFELFYWHGGHGGPYASLADAIQGAPFVAQAVKQVLDFQKYSMNGPHTFQYALEFNRMLSTLHSNVQSDIDLSLKFSGIIGEVRQDI